MSELPTTLPDKEAYQELAAEAPTTEEIVTLREMAQADLAQASLQSEQVTITAESGEKVDVTAIGQERFAELQQKQLDPEAVQAAMAVNSDGWQSEEK